MRPFTDVMSVVEPAPHFILAHFSQYNHELIKLVNYEKVVIRHYCSDRIINIS